MNRVENIVTKGEIVWYDQFGFCHNVFKRCLLQMRQNVSAGGDKPTNFQWFKSLGVTDLFTVIYGTSAGKHFVIFVNCSTNNYNLFIL